MPLPLYVYTSHVRRLRILERDQGRNESHPQIVCIRVWVPIPFMAYGQAQRDPTGWGSSPRERVK
ncbi:MAG: hypothetical protein WA376_18205 [Terrimicrobiaceae bacterium]